MRQRLHLSLALVAALSLLPLGGGGFTAEEAVQEPAPDAGQQTATVDPDTITRILKDNEAMLSGRSFSYDPAGRRDPFRSLVDSLNSRKKGPRPSGIAGMLIGEVDLVGIVKKGVRYIAFFNGSDNKGYFLNVGDTLYDGKIIKIDRTSGSVVFRQEINDPRSIKPYRDVTKKLALGEEDRI